MIYPFPLYAGRLEPALTPMQSGRIDGGDTPGQSLFRRDQRRLRPPRFCLPPMLFGRFTKLDILAEAPEANRLERVLPRFSASQIIGNVRSPKPHRIIRSLRGRYSIRTLWSPGGNRTPTKLGISITVSVFTPSTVARQFG